MKRVEGFMRGVNLGGWMSHEMHDAEHISAFITEEDFARVTSWGVDHVRVPVDYEVFEPQKDGSEGIGYAYCDKAVSWCRKYGLHMILDLHKAAGFSYEAMYNESGLFESEALQEKLCATWEGFARRYGSDDGLVAFELLNEVTEPKVIGVWNRVAGEAMRRIRRYAPHNWIMVGSYWNNSLDALPDLDLPADDHLAYVFHCYDPIMFTHQGAMWVKDMPSDFRMDYPCTLREHAQKAAMIGMDTAGDPQSTAMIDSEFFRARFERMANMCEQRGVGLCCTEYGVIENAQDDAVLRWYRDVHAAFDALGIGRTSWNYKVMNFGLLERREILDRLIRYL